MNRSAEFFRALVERAGEITVVLSEDGRVEYVSGAVERILGHRASWREARDAFHLVHPEDLSRVLADFATKVERPEQGEPITFRMRHADGSWRHVEAVGANLLDAPEVGAIVVNLRDVTSRVEAEAQHRQAASRYQRALDVSPQPIAVHQDGVLVYANHAAAELLGAPAVADLVGRAVADIVPEDSAASVAVRMARVLSGEEVELAEQQLRRLDGTLVDVEVAAVPIDWLGRPAAQVVARDLTERNRSRAELEHQARHDPLTGRPNRVLLLERLREAEAARRRTGQPYAVVFTDLDQFKVLNDALGHHAGDIVLQAVADRLAAVARPHDTVARFGGDEFVLIIERLEPDTDIDVVVRRFANALHEPIPVGANRVRVGLSGGIVVVDEPVSTRDLLSEADAALYRAKHLGRGRFERFDEALRDKALERLRMEEELHQALDHAELVPYVQTEVSLATGDVLGVEVLCRWSHPTRGLLGPEHFLEVVEEMGAIHRLGDRMRAEALAFLASERADGRLHDGWVSVNVSAAELLDHDFSQRVLGDLARFSLPGSALCLELTESSLAADPVMAATVVTGLRAHGVTFAVDDFGTGYASLSYLGRFAPEFVKIDRSFTGGMLGDDRQLALVRSAIEMAHAFGALAVAEGIETEEQAARLRSLGCDIGQGYLYSRPQPTG